MDLPVLNFAETMAALPAQQPDEGLDQAIKKAYRQNYDAVLVLDDDPTGTQTVYDVPIVTHPSMIYKELIGGTKLLFYLTNSRSVSEKTAHRLAMMAASNCPGGATRLSMNILMIVRGDSTLRGHYPWEESGWRGRASQRDRAHYFIPAFFEGGRYTINDVHYVQEKEVLIPAAQTPFAKDASFSYSHSNLRYYLMEKWNAGISKYPWIEKAIESEYASISIKSLRTKSNSDLVTEVNAIPESVKSTVVNAANYNDLKRAVLAILTADRKAILRTSASFIKALLGQPDRPLLTFPKQAKLGGLIVVGSHVPKTTAQLQHLQAMHTLETFEVDVRALLAQEASIAPAALAKKIAEAYCAGRNVLLYTSREVITTKGAAANLDIAATVSGYLEAVVAALPSAPAFLLTKGGITSSRIATESLGVKRAMAIGQVQPGVPTWELGPESKFPGLPFIIFPGNVGEEDSLSRILQNTFI